MSHVFKYVPGGGLAALVYWQFHLADLRSCFFLAVGAVLMVWQYHAQQQHA